jgi:hypothetical protein
VIAQRPSAGALGLALSTVSLAAVNACEVRLSHNWSAVRGGFGTLMMARDGPPCGATIHAHRLEKSSVQALRLAGAPAHGQVRIEGAAFSYRPNPGFVGEDRFGLVGIGTNPNGRPLRVRGTITVLVR